MYVKYMCDLLIQTTSRGYMLAFQATSASLCTVRSAYNFVTSKVVDVTYALFGAKTAKVTYEVLETLPFSIAVIAYPVPTLASILLVHILARDFIFDGSVYYKAPIILRNIPAVKVLQHAIGCAVRHPSSTLIKVGLWLIITLVTQVALTKFEYFVDDDYEEETVIL